MNPATITSGGSAANTIVGAASFGAKAAFIGKVKSDSLGQVFSHDIRAMGVEFDTAPAAEGPATARCFVLVTPDGERTMNTYLGACQNLTPADVEEAIVKASSFIYLEGYLWDPPEAKKALLKAAQIAHAADRSVALTLSDPFCVDRTARNFSTSFNRGRSTSSSPTSMSSFRSTRRRISTRRSRLCGRRKCSES